MNIALVGNQNSGKTTLFNLLTGKNQTVANYPGATVDFYTGTSKDKKETYIDLPGIHSLNPYSTDQELTTAYLLNEEVDLILNVIDATQLEKGLYLTTQLLELDIPVVVALNMTDRLHQDQGIQFHLKTLEKQFGASFFSISATKNIGIADLLCSIKAKDYLTNKIKPWLSFIEPELNQIENILNLKHTRYYAIKLLENKEPFINEVVEIQNNLKQHYQDDLYELFAEKRYAFIEKALSYSTKILTKYDKITNSLDKVLLNKYLAIPIFLIIMFAVYSISVGFIGQLGIEYIETFFEWFSELLRVFLLNKGASSWSVSLLVDGAIRGIGAMAPFIPQLFVLFLFINLLEATGYMNRISYFLDRVFRRFGLSGRALIPFIIGSGCSVPAVFSTRTIEDKKEREMTVILTPFIPCSAKLPVISIFAGAFFGKYAGLVTFLIYVISILVIVLSAVIMKYIFKIKRPKGYMSELPSYKIPKLKYTLRTILTQLWDFIKNATTIIVFSSIILWFLLSFNFRFQYGIPIEQSMLANIGKVLSYLFYPIIGKLSWASSVSIIQGFVAKENVIVSMEVIAGVSGSSNIFNSSLFSFFTVSSAMGFMLFNIFSAPCFAAIGAMKAELKSTKKTALGVLYQTLFAYAFSSIIFLILRMVGL